MKKLTCLCLAVLLAAMLFACAATHDYTPTEETTTAAPTEPAPLPTTVPLPTWDEDDPYGEAVAREWVARMETILQASITGLEFTIGHVLFPEDGSTYTFGDSDIAVTQRWLTLLSQLEVSVVPFQASIGGGYARLAFFAGEERFELIDDFPSWQQHMHFRNEDGRSTHMLYLENPQQQEILARLRDEMTL